MQKNKKLVTESSQQQKRSLRIADSPKKITKLKLSNLLQASKERQMEQINEAVRQKLDQQPQTTLKNKGVNPYQISYLNDLNHWKQYCEATQRYQQGGINLKWPYYFSAPQQDFNKEG